MIMCFNFNAVQRQNTVEAVGYLIFTAFPAVGRYYGLIMQTKKAGAQKSHETC